MTHPAQPHTCACCGYTGSDLRIKGCSNGCTYHARCIDLMAICRRVPPTQVGSAAMATAAPPQQVTTKTSDGLTDLTSCPCCSSPATGLEILPLSFTEMDHAQRLSGYKSGGSSGGGGILSTPPGKRMHVELMNSGSDGGSESSYYDPATPRTGKWSDEEIAFRDNMVPHFMEGSLPLSNGLKLIEFLSQILKSKPSRLTKKMKHAKLSTRHFHLDSGFIRSIDRAKELSRLEVAFVNGISDAVERSQIKFHMQREWRDHLAERLTHLRISFDAEEWLKSVDVMDRRIALAKSRNRMVKRRFMMGKAMEKDTSSPTPGIFIDTSVDNSHQDDVDLELLASALEANDAEDADLSALYSSMAADHATATGGAGSGDTVYEVSVDGSRQCSALDGSGRSSIVASPSAQKHQQHQAPFHSALLPSLGSAEGPNFKFAAPFLAKITAYIERNRVPFEHIDIWVPSSSNPNVLDPTGATAPEPSLLGSGSSNTKNGTGRLCFAGSASVGVQIIPNEEESLLQPQAQPLSTTGFDHRSKPGTKLVPLSSDEIYHLSLFGSYSEKFSFSSGCGLPGRVFESAVPAWEQFIANAPSHLFERRGGAMQFGIKTALGLPIRSPNVGRIVLVLYSKHNREKDDELVAQMVRDFQSLNPCPRWKLMVDMGNTATPSLNPVSHEAPVEQNSQQQATSSSQQMKTGLSEKNIQISNLISLLGENIPSDQTSPLAQQIPNIMSLRLVLLKRNRTSDDEQLVDSIITLFDSYVTAGRSRPDITLMLARDFAFHNSMNQQLHQHQYQQLAATPLHHSTSHHSINSQQPGFQRQVSLPTMNQLSIDASQHSQQEPSCQLEHTHHGQTHRQDRSFSMIEAGTSPNPDFQLNPSTMIQRHSVVTMNRGPSSTSISTLTEQNYSNPDFQQSKSPRSASSSLSRLLENKPLHHQQLPLSEPPASLN